MPPNPPLNPDLRRQIKQRLLEMSPRAFELFAGDLLEYVGLQNVAVTQYIGDGGIDAQGDLIATSSLVRVPTGVQIKRHRHNVQRPDIDRFIGALGGRFHHGIFITTAGYAPQARTKAVSSPFVRVDTVDGDQVAALMTQHNLGVQPSNQLPTLDQDYFLGFEALASTVPKVVREQNEMYQVNAQDDLISLQALSYALRVDTTTVRRWVEMSRILPDQTSAEGKYFFRRDRIDSIRVQMRIKAAPDSSDATRQEFLDFVKSRNLTKSYKPVLVKSLLKLVDRNGRVQIDDLVHEFRAFYIQRYQLGLPVEYGVHLLEKPDTARDTDIKRLIVKYPLDRFLIKRYLEYLSGEGVIQFASQLWQELRYYDIIDIINSVDEQIRYYYSRSAPVS